MSTRIYADTEITSTGTFTNQAGDLADPSTVTFTYRYEYDGKERTATPVQSSTGIYTATFLLEFPGFVYTQWKGSGNVTRAIENTIFVEPTRFPRNLNLKDYNRRWW